MMARQQLSTSPPSESTTCTSARTCQQFFPAAMQSDSVSSALDRRIILSRVRTSCDSSSDCLLGEKMGLSNYIENTFNDMALGGPVSVPSRFVGRRSHVIKFHRHCENSIVLSLGAGFGHLRRYAHHNTNIRVS